MIQSLALPVGGGTGTAAKAGHVGVRIFTVTATARGVFGVM